MKPVASAACHGGEAFTEVAGTTTLLWQTRDHIFFSYGSRFSTGFRTHVPEQLVEERPGAAGRAKETPNSAEHEVVRAADGFLKDHPLGCSVSYFGGKITVSTIEIGPPRKVGTTVFALDESASHFKRAKHKDLVVIHYEWVPQIPPADAGIGLDAGRRLGGMLGGRGRFDQAGTQKGSGDKRLFAWESPSLRFRDSGA